MFGIADYPAFVLAVIVFLAIPGPGNLALLTSTAKGGLRGGLAATLGVMAGRAGVSSVAGVMVRKYRKRERSQAVAPALKYELISSPKYCSAFLIGKGTPPPRAQSEVSSIVSSRSARSVRSIL